MSPKGCLKELINATTGGDETLATMITPSCFDKLNLVLVNNTGAKGCPERTFTGGLRTEARVVCVDRCQSGWGTVRPRTCRVLQALTGQPVPTD